MKIEFMLEEKKNILQWDLNKLHLDSFVWELQERFKKVGKVFKKGLKKNYENLRKSF